MNNKIRRLTQNGKFTQYEHYYFNYPINTPSKRFACFHNKLLKHFIPFFLRSKLKRTNIFSCVIIRDRCWVVHIPFVRVVKFQFLAQFLMDHFAYSIGSCLIVFLC